MCLHLAAITLTVHRFVGSSEVDTQIDLLDYLLSSYCMSVTDVVQRIKRDCQVIKRAAHSRDY
jgi:hypothetical protein